MFPFVQLVWSFGFIACFCEMGELVIQHSANHKRIICSWIHITYFYLKVTHQFIRFNAKLCQCDWYLFPIGIQRMLVIFMSDTQQPVSIQGYGNIQCKRENFKTVRINFIPNQFNPIPSTWKHFEYNHFVFHFYHSQTINGGFSYLITLQRINRYASGKLWKWKKNIEWNLFVACWICFEDGKISMNWAWPNIKWINDK